MALQDYQLTKKHTNMIKTITTNVLLAAFSLTAFAQEDVTARHIKNPDFEVNYLTYWKNSGMQMQNNTSFQKNGGVYAEKWASKGSKVGNGSMTQEILRLPQGKYTLKAKAQNIQQDSPDKAQTGAEIFAGDAATTVTTQGEYELEFTHLHGDITIGFRLKNASGNYACIDDFRLYRNGDAYEGAQADDDALYAKEEKQLRELYANATGNVPTVTGSSYIGIGSTFALGRSTIKNNGAIVVEKGYCYSSTNEEPTVFDNKSTYFWSHEGNIYVIEPLEPQTAYWIRPYVITRDNVVAYGEPKYISTLSKPSCRWTYGYEGNDEQNARIVQAVSNGIQNYNDCSAIKNFTLQAHYVQGAGAGGGTADCSYGGYMRISQSTAYQRTGTVQHEFAHGVGVGTRRSDWGYAQIGAYNYPELHNWEWYGRRANDLAHFIENSQEVQVVGDATHSWVQNTNGRTNKLINYGINGAQEDDNSQILYRCNAMMIEAMCEDGLCPTNSYSVGVPAYTYMYTPGKKYYLMSKSETGGLGEGLLYQRATTDVGWKPFISSNEEITDSAAWYIEYIPSAGCYAFKNAWSGKYLTHKANGTTITMKTTATPTSTEQFQLIPDRTNVTVGTGDTKFTTHGYWFTWSSNGAKAMQANKFGSFTKYGRISQENLNFASAAAEQQWLLISEDEISKYRSAAIATGIGCIKVNETTAEGKTVTGIYNAGAVKTEKTQSGLNIIKYSDGTSKKIFVK